MVIDILKILFKNKTYNYINIYIKIEKEEKKIYLKIKKEISQPNNIKINKYKKNKKTTKITTKMAKDRKTNRK